MYESALIGCTVSFQKDIHTIITGTVVEAYLALKYHSLSSREQLMVGAAVTKYLIRETTSGKVHSVWSEDIILMD